MKLENVQLCSKMKKKMKIRSIKTKKPLNNYKKIKDINLESEEKFFPCF